MFSGYKICILRNSWIDDTNVIDSSISCKIKLFLKGLADYYFESAQIGIVRPCANIYHYVMKVLNVQASEVIYAICSTMYIGALLRLAHNAS